MSALQLCMTRWPWWLWGFLLLPGLALAHERFIPHELMVPLSRDFFRRLDPNMLNIAVRVAVVMATMLFLWFLRDPLDNLIENRVLHNLRGKLKYWVHLLACYVTDKPVDHPWYTRVGEWIVVLFLRCPALVLMYSATNDSLVMPSYPLEPSTTTVFKYAQVIMAMGIITQRWMCCPCSPSPWSTCRRRECHRRTPSPTSPRCRCAGYA